MFTPALDRIEILRTRLLAASLSGNSSIDQIAELCASELVSLIQFELYSVYLLDGIGGVRRAAAVRNGAGPIPDFNSPADEHWLYSLPMCEIGQPYAEVLIATGESLSADDPLRAPFERTIGPLEFVGRFPINGSSRSFGVLEVANVRLGDGLDADRRALLQAELNILMLVASVLASAITTWRARNESLVLADIMKKLAQAESADDTTLQETQTAFERALQAALDRLSDYRAAVLRISSREKSVRIFAKAKQHDMTWDGWQDLELKAGQYLAGRVFASGCVQVVPVIQNELELFASPDWILGAKVKSAACFPVRGLGTTLGTFTVYTGFLYEFSDLDSSVLASISDAFGLFWGRFHAQEQKSKAEKELTRVRGALEEARLSAARQAAIMPYVTLLHQAKNSWADALRALEKRGASALPEVIKVGTQMRDLLSGESIMDVRATDTIDVQEALSEIIKARQVALRKSGIRITLQTKTVPLIKMPRHLFNEIIFNLLSNAERAIYAAKRDNGLIEVSVGLEPGKHSDTLTLKVSDNGIGIPRDKLEKIFERGYTTFADVGGTGLGLFLVVDIIEDFNGTIYAESRWGNGAAFTVRLPLSWLAA